MTADDRLRISIASARYLEAFEADDHAALAALWDLAGRDPDLFAAFRDIHDGLVEESARRPVADAVRATVGRHLTSGEVVRPAAAVVTVADVADDLHRHTPGSLPAAAHALNERLRAVRDPLPDDLGLSKLLAWAGRFGAGPEAYWRAFREAAVRLEVRRAAEAEYQLAARPAGPGGRP